MKKWKILIVGGGSLHVQEILHCFEERRFPVEKIRLFAEGERCGEINDFLGEPLWVSNISDIPEEAYDVAILLSPLTDLKTFTTQMVIGKIPIIDISRSFSPGPSIPMLRLEELQDELKAIPAVSILPSPVVLALASFLSIVNMNSKVESIIISATQGVSQAGSKRAMDELFDQTRAIMAFQDPEPKEFSKQIAFNHLPIHDIASLEEQLRNEFRYLLGHEELNMSIDVHWGCFFVGVIGSVWVRTEEPVDLEGICNQLKSVSELQYYSEEENPGVLESVGQNFIILSGLRGNPSDDRGLTLRFTLDNLRKGLSIQVVKILEHFNEVGKL